MPADRNPYFSDIVKDEIGVLAKSFNYASVEDITTLIRELDALVRVDPVTGKTELLLRDFPKKMTTNETLRTHRYPIGEVSGNKYHVLIFGAVQSFVSFVGETLVVLWFGSSKLKHEEQEQVKEIAASRLQEYLEEME